LTTFTYFGTLDARFTREASRSPAWRERASSVHDAALRERRTRKKWRAAECRPRPKNRHENRSKKNVRAGTSGTDVGDRVRLVAYWTLTVPFMPECSVHE
jgi:hypothetical protein